MSKKKSFIRRGTDGKYRIYALSPFGQGLAEQIKGTRAYKTYPNAEKSRKKLRKVV